MNNREELEAERAELVSENEAATSWGAAVGARSERIRGIDRQLLRMAKSSDPAPAAPTWDERLFDRLAQLQAGGVKKMTIHQVVGLIGFVRDGEGGAPPVRSAASSVEPVAGDMSLALKSGISAALNKMSRAGAGILSDYSARTLLEEITTAIARAAPTTSPEPDAVREHINARLEDLATANALYGKDQRLSAPDKIERNNREISWLKDLRSLIALSRPAHGGWDEMRVLSKCTGYRWSAFGMQQAPRPQEMEWVRISELRAALADPRHDRVTSQPDTDAVTIVAPPIPPLLQREWMAQALFEVDAPDHREWEDVWLDERERYLRLVDTAIAKNLALTGDR